MMLITPALAPSPPSTIPLDLIISIFSTWFGDILERSCADISILFNFLPLTLMTIFWYPSPIPYPCISSFWVNGFPYEGIVVTEVSLFKNS